MFVPVLADKALGASDAFLFLRKGQMVQSNPYGTQVIKAVLEFLRIKPFQVCPNLVLRMQFVEDRILKGIENVCQITVVDIPVGFPSVHEGADPDLAIGHDPHRG